MKNFNIVRSWSAFCLLLLMAGMLIADEPPEGYVALFNGKDLAGWEQVNGSTFTAEEGVIKHRQGMGWLRTTDQFDNFILKLEVRWLKERQDSGVFFGLVWRGATGPIANTKYSAKTVSGSCISLARTANAILPSRKSSSSRPANGTRWRSFATAVAVK